MGSRQLRIILRLSLEIHLSEHIQGRFLSLLAWPGLGFDRTSYLPALLTAAEPKCLAVISGSDDLALAVPDETCERKSLRTDVDDGSWRLLRTARVDDGDTAVMCCKR